MSHLHAKQAKTPSAAAADLEQRYRNNRYWPLRRLICVCEQDHVIVRGMVPTFYLRQIADSLAANVVGLGRVLSEIQVSPELGTTSVWLEE